MGLRYLAALDAVEVSDQLRRNLTRRINGNDLQSRARLRAVELLPGGCRISEQICNDEDPMSNATERLEKVLAALGETSEFVVWGTLPPALPGLEVTGVGSIGLPVSAEEAQRLIAVADQAPYGRGSETIVDPEVRRVWQLEPSRFELRNPAWDAQVDAIVEAVRQRLAIRGAIRHELYKLLVYEAGSFFAPHRDTEKTPGMFATLVVCLPSRHEGGTLIAEHDGQTERIDFGGPDSEFRTAYAAFYADCRHEITPVLSGYRVCLVYNLALDRAGTQPSAPRSSPAVAEAAAMLRALFADQAHGRNKVIIPLEHQYTMEGLHPAALKGADRARAEVLSRAAASLDYDCSLALVTHYQTGSMDSDDYWDDYGDDEEETSGPEDAGMLEVFDDTITLSHWREMSGRERPLGELHVAENELLCRDDRKGWSVSQQIHEATGNEGATLERWYRNCALLIWPRDRFFRILAAEGQAVALPELERMAAQAEDEDALSECRRFAGTISNYWVKSPGPGGGESWSGRMLAVLERIGTVELAQQFVREVLPMDFNGQEGAALGRLCQQFGWEALRPALAAFLERQQPAPWEVAPARLLALMASLYQEPATWTPERRSAGALLAHELAGVVERWGIQSVPGYLLNGESCAGLVANAVRVFALGAAPEALDKFLDRALRGELGCELHSVLIPDLKAIAGWLPEAPAARPTYARLREHCLAQLRSATAEPVLAPADWRRDAELGCNCQDCQALSRFLADPAAPVARFPLAEQRRRHLHARIDHQRCDCTHVTERKGRPYTLVCQKTSASYERRKRQYQWDRKLLAEIERLPSG